MENQEKQNLTTADLKRTLGKKELYSIAFGHVIGSGVFSLIGVGIGMTGKSVFIGILISSIFVLIQALPLILISGTARFRGGLYSIMATLWGEKFAGFYIVIYFVANISLAMYALSFAQYLQGIVPSAPITPVALLVLTVFFIANLLGIEGAAKLEIAMDIILAVALTAFIVYGLPQVDYENFLTEDFMTAGPMGLMSCGVLLTWATAGGSDMINLSAEAKNPTKDLPQVIVVATVGVAVFYALIAVVAGGVLPISQTADQPLDVVAKVIFPTPVYLFFIIAGALLALSTTLNASFAWVTKPILQACNDGWLPKKLGYIHPKFKTPVLILAVFYVIGLLPIVFGFDIGMIADIAVIMNCTLFILICLGAIYMPKKLPELWEKSSFRCGQTKLWAYAILGSLSSLITVGLLLVDVGKTQAIGLIIITLIAIVYAYLRYKSGKVDMQESCEAM